MRTTRERRSGPLLTETLIRSRLLAMRQFTKLESMKSDALAALAAGRWQMAVLCARAALLFAIDVLQASRGGDRDEIHRLSAERLRPLRDVSALPLIQQLLASPSHNESASEFVSSCLAAIEQLPLADLVIPPYFDPKTRMLHETERTQLESWLPIRIED